MLLFVFIVLSEATWPVSIPGKYGVQLLTCGADPCGFSNTGASLNLGKAGELFRVLDNHAGTLDSSRLRLVGRHLYVYSVAHKIVRVFDTVDGWFTDDMPVDLMATSQVGLSEQECPYYIGKSTNPNRPFDLRTGKYIDVDVKRGFNWLLCKENDIPNGGIFVKQLSNLVIYKTPSGYHAYDPLTVKATILVAKTTADKNTIHVMYSPNEFDRYTGLVTIGDDTNNNYTHDYVKSAEMLLKIINDVNVGDPLFTLAADIRKSDNVAHVSIKFNIKYVDAPLTMILRGDTDKLAALERRVDYLIGRSA